MIKKLFFYSVIFFTFVLLVSGSFYTYNVYYLNKPIIIKGFEAKIKKLIKQFVLEKPNFTNYDLKVNKSVIEIDKLPNLLRLKLIDVQIDDKKNSLTSKLNDLRISLSIKEIFDIILNDKSLSLNKLEIDNVNINASLNESGLVPGPMASFFINAINSNVGDKFLNFTKKQFKIKHATLFIEDKINLFKEKNVRFQCKNLTFSRFTDKVNNFNLRCNKDDIAKFEINISNTEDNKIIVEGFTKTIESKLFNLEKIKLQNVLNGFFAVDFRLEFSKNYLLEKFKLDIKEKSYLVLLKHDEKESFFKRKKIDIKGNINWNSRDKLLYLDNFVFNENFLNGKIFQKNQKFLIDLNFKFDKLNLVRLRNFYSNNNNAELLKNIGFKNSFQNLNSGILKDFKINFLFEYDKSLDTFLFNKTKGDGKLSNFSFTNYNQFFEKIDGKLEGDFNFFLDNEDFLFDLEGSSKDTSFVVKNTNKNIFFDKIKLSTSVHNSMFLIKRADFINNGKKEILTNGKLWAKNGEFYLGDLSLKINEISYKRFFSLANIFYKDGKLSKIKFHKGKLVNSSFFLKNKDERGNDLDKSIFFGELKLKDAILKMDNLDEKIRINNLTLNFDKKTNLFGKIDGYFNKFPFKLNYKFDKKNHIKSFGKIIPNKELEDFIFAKTDFKIKKFPEVNFLLNGRILDGFFSIETYSDNFFSEIKNTLLNINKKNNEAGNFKAVFKYKDFKLTSIENFNLIYGKNKFSAFLKINEDNSFEILNLKSKDFDIKKLKFSNDEKEIHITAQGNFFDISFLKDNLKNQTFLKKKKINFDLISPKIKVDSNLFIAGNYRGKLELKKIVSIADGKIFLGEKSILDEGEIEIKGENNDFVLTGHGHLGGANTKISIKSLGDKLPQLFFDTEDGGKLLDALNFTNKIKSGAMVLQINFLDEELNKYSGSINAKNFSIINAPGIVKSLSSLSFSGINSLFVGQGVKFESGVASFLNNENEMIFEKILINNDTLTIFLNGKYYSKENNVDFTGSIAPIKLISRLVSVVPAIGELLTGLDKKGLFVGQFKLSGNVESPNIDINEMSFAPGILREIFSKDWIKEKKIQLTK